MGNQSSNLDTTTNIPWTSEEQCQLRKQYQCLVNRTPLSWPPTFEDALVNSLALRHVQKGYEAFVNALLPIMSDDSSCAQSFADVVKYSLQQDSVSISDVVTWIVRAGVPIWFAASGHVISSESLQEDNHSGLETLVYYLLTKAKQDDVRRQKRKAEEEAWIQGLASVEPATSDHALDAWLQQIMTAQPTTLTPPTLVSWASSTSALLILFRLCAQRLFFGEQDGDTSTESTHTRRVAHLCSPRLQLPSDATDAQHFSRLMDAYDYFLLCNYLPADALSWTSYEREERRVSDDVAHQRIFSSLLDGESWHKFVDKLVGKGATLVIIRAKDGSVFGGYADHTWEPSTDWYGNPSNFLFRLRGPRPSAGVWTATSSGNNHFQYLCWGRMSLGMGGQLDFPGLWIDSDFVHGSSNGAPECTTYGSPPLATQDTFLIDEVEVWLVRPRKLDPDEVDHTQTSILERQEDMAFLEISGKKMYSRDVAKVSDTARQ